MAITADKVTNLIRTLKDYFEAKGNKATDLSGTFSDDTEYPSAKATKTYVSSAISGKADVSDVPTKTSDLTNDSGFLTSHNPVDATLSETSENAVQNKVVKAALDNKQDASTAFSGDYDDLSNKPTNVSEFTNDAGYLTAHQDISGKADTVHTHTVSSITDFPTLATVATSGSYDDLDDTPTLATVATSGSYNDLSNTPDLSDFGGIISIEKQTTAETGYAHTYVISQGGTALSTKINIPKDYLVKSATLETAAAADLSTLGAGFSAGDKYIDFVVNTVDNADDESSHIYINLKDLVDTYEADESTLTLSNNEFSVKTNGITTTELATSIVTSLGYADAYHSSPAASITSTDVSNWNAKSNLTVSDVDSEIDLLLDSLIAGFSSN